MEGVILGILHGRPRTILSLASLFVDGRAPFLGSSMAALCRLKGTITWMPPPLRSSPPPCISPSIGNSLPRLAFRAPIPRLSPKHPPSHPPPPLCKSPSSLLHHLLVESHHRNDGHCLVARHIVLGSEQSKVTRLLLPFGATMPPSPSPATPPPPPPSHRLPSLRRPNGAVA
jgi:hypothetical protein